MEYQSNCNPMNVEEFWTFHYKKRDVIIVCKNFIVGKLLIVSMYISIQSADKLDLSILIHKDHAVSLPLVYICECHKDRYSYLMHTCKYAENKLQ